MTKNIFRVRVSVRARVEVRATVRVRVGLEPLTKFSLG